MLFGPWDASAKAGISEGTPWLPGPASAATINVARQKSGDAEERSQLAVCLVPELDPLEEDGSSF